MISYLYFKTRNSFYEFMLSDRRRCRPKISIIITFEIFCNLIFITYFIIIRKIKILIYRSYLKKKKKKS